MSKTQAVEIAGVRLTSPDRVLYEEQGITKRELAEYYQRVAEHVLPEVADRPLTLIRCPQGQSRQCFVQRRFSESFPRSVRPVRVEVEGEEETAEHIAVNSLEGIVYLTQIGVLEMHTWGARRDRLDRPDRLVFDLDPDPALPFAAVVEAALRLRERLQQLRLPAFAKTSGGKGLHVVVPLARGSTWDQVRGFSRAVAEQLEASDPDRFVAEASKAERSGRVYVDYLRNAWAASTVAAYSSRAKTGAPVSTPLHWEELDPGLDPAEFNVRTVPARLARSKRDPWATYDQERKSLTREIRARVGLE